MIVVGEAGVLGKTRGDGVEKDWVVKGEGDVGLCACEA